MDANGLEAVDPLYPDWHWQHDVDQLLFDLGYSYGCLTECESVLRGFVSAARTNLGESDDPEAYGLLLGRIEPLVAKLESLRKGRLQPSDEIYHVAYAWEQGAKATKRVGTHMFQASYSPQSGVEFGVCVFCGAGAEALGMPCAGRQE